MYTLSLLAERFAIVQLPPGTSIPEWAVGGELLSVTHTPEEVSIVCDAMKLPEDMPAERGWRALKVHGPLPFNLVGVQAALTAPLAEAEISVFAVSTYATDYILVKEERLHDALMSLRQAGHIVRLIPSAVIHT